MSFVGIVSKYSNFVGHPITVNGDRINLIQVFVERCFFVFIIACVHVCILN